MHTSSSIYEVFIPLYNGLIVKCPVVTAGLEVNLDLLDASVTWFQVSRMRLAANPRYYAQRNAGL